MDTKRPLVGDGTRFLNEEVAEEVLADPELKIAWYLTSSKWDWERDPLHNPSYVEIWKKDEADRLVKLKRRIAEIKAE